MRFLIFLFLCTIGYSQDYNNPKALNDSAFVTYKQNPEKAIRMFKDADSISSLNEDSLEKARATNGLGLVYRDLGEYEKAIQLSQKALIISTDKLVAASAYNNIGASQRQLGKYQDALQNYLKSLEIYDSIGERQKSATVTNNIGLVYSYLDIVDKAIEYHKKAKDVFEELDYKKGMSEALNNIAIIYANEGDLKTALSYFQESLRIEITLKDKRGIAESANNVGAVHYYLQNVDSALYYFNTSANLEKDLKNFAGVGSSYNNIAQVLLENNRLSESKTYIDSAYHYATKYKITTDIETAYYNYSQYFEVKGDNSNALDYFKKYSNFRDSIVNVESNSKIAQLEIEFQSEQKEKQILSQRADLAEKELDLSKKNNYILGLAMLAALVLVLGFLFYNNQKQKNRQLKQENALKDALQRIETQDKLQNQRLRISRDLHDNIGAQLTFIISSIDNLKYGIKLPVKLEEKLSNINAFAHNTIAELRDTIWAMNKSEITFEDLQIRVSNFIDKANLSSKNIAFNFEISEEINQKQVFTSVVGMNIYRIIQESINNAMKYSEATEISVDVSKKDDATIFSVKDNGNGFDEANIELGNGLNNMKKRAEEINAQLSLQSGIGKGTVVTFRL